jgi:hypothetical protein
LPDVAQPDHYEKARYGVPFLFQENQVVDGFSSAPGTIFQGSFVLNQ